VAHLPVSHRYTTSHAWIAAAPGLEGTWRVGLTRFALRMLGELVEIQFEAARGQPVQLGEVLGNVEGFKALSDLFSVVEGTFAGGNPALNQGLEQLGKDPHHAWLYQVAGTPDPRSVDVAGYIAILDATIDRILEQQKTREADPSGDVSNRD
jgi:glycine cleavage system H protein